jgi:hypothetical protein
MIRNLKILLAAVMALVTLGAISASGAQAAEYHCTVEPCRGTLKPDGAVPSKTAHHVFVVKGKNAAGEPVSGSFTCNQLTGEGLSNTKTTKEFTATGLACDGCAIVGTPCDVDFNGCDYHFVAGPPSTVTIKCPAGKQIEITIKENGTTLKCTIDIPAQGPLGGITYHDAAEPPTRTELTVQALVKDITGIIATPAAGSSCIPYVGFNGSATEGEYTTGNTIVTGETITGVHVGGWYE